MSTRARSGPYVAGLCTEKKTDFLLIVEDIILPPNPFIAATFPLLPLEGVEVHTSHRRLFPKSKPQPYLKTTFDLHLEGFLCKRKAGDLQ